MDSRGRAAAQQQCVAQEQQLQAGPGSSRLLHRSELHAGCSSGWQWSLRLQGWGVMAFPTSLRSHGAAAAEQRDIERQQSKVLLL